jgi:hypothetical protein
MEENKVGRRTVKTPELVQEILDLVIAGYNMDGICSRKGIPDRATVYRWLLDDAVFNKAYKEAVSLRAHNTFLDVFEIADRPKATIKDVAADRLRCNVRLRAAAIANPSLKRRRKTQARRKARFRLPDELNVTIIRPDDEAIESGE